MPYCVYKITNKINNKIYVGFHTIKNCNLDDGYMGSGKLIQRAINIHGVENFEKEIIKIFHNRKDAESLEYDIVNEDFIKRDDTYNIVTGGNVTILYGEMNGFYKKKHSKESIDKLQSSRNKTITDRGYFKKTEWHGYIDNIEFHNITQLKSLLGYKSIRKIIKLFVENNKYMGFVDIAHQQRIEKIYSKIIAHELYMRKIKSEMTSIRFKNIPKSKEHRDKIGRANKGRHQWWQNKINKNPEKIRKSAETHTGMKRSEEAVKNISKAQKLRYENGAESSIKNRKCYYDPISLKIGYFKEDEQPKDWLKGNPNTKKKCYYCPETLECKRFKENHQPEGWLLGQPTHAKTKKNYNTVNTLKYE